MSREEFDRIVREEFEALPPAIRDKMRGVTILVSESRRGLLGLYEGTPLAQRGEGEPVLPDRITLYRREIELEGGTPEGIRKVVRETLLHEIGHALGLDEEQLGRLGLP